MGNRKWKQTRRQLRPTQEQIDREKREGARAPVLYRIASRLGFPGPLRRWRERWEREHNRRLKRAMKRVSHRVG